MLIQVQMGATVEKMKVDPGDVILVKIKLVDVTQNMADQIKQSVSECFPENKVLVVGECLSITTFKIEGQAIPCQPEAY